MTPPSNTYTIISPSEFSLMPQRLGILLKDASFLSAFSTAKMLYGEFLGGVGAVLAGKAVLLKLQFQHFYGTHINHYSYRRFVDATESLSVASASDWACPYRRITAHITNAISLQSEFKRSRFSVAFVFLCTNRVLQFCVHT